MANLRALIIKFRKWLLAGAAGGVALLGVMLLGIFMPGPHDETRRVVLERGASLRSVTAQLAAADTLRNGLLFRLYVRLRGDAARLKAGEFDLPARANMETIRRLLIKGDVVLHKITFAEGLTSQQIIAQLRDAAVLSGEVSVPLEGTLLPETYAVPRGMSRQALVKKMMAAQKTALDELWPQRQKGLPLASKYEALILASIVERETGVAEERPLVAAAFINRLKKRMRLQSDPTIIYGLVGGQGKLGRPAKSAARHPITPIGLTACRPRRLPIRGALPSPPCLIRQTARRCISSLMAPVGMFLPRPCRRITRMSGAGEKSKNSKNDNPLYSAKVF